MKDGKNSRFDSQVLVAGLQHAIAMFPGVVMVPLIIARAAGFGSAEATRIVGMAVFVSGVATLLQVLRCGPIGSGWLCVMGSSGLFIPPCIAAGKIGGPGLVFGMTLALSPVQAVMSRLVPVLQKICPSAVVGTIIFLIGLGILPVSVYEFGGGRGVDDFGSLKHLLVGTATIVATVVAAVSRRRYLHLSSILFGSGVGYVLGACLGLARWEAFAQAQLFSFPRFFTGGFSFSWSLFPIFLIAYFITSLETFGDMNAIGEISGEKAGAVNPKRVAGGMLADAVGSALSGLFGTTANTSYSGNIGIAKLTGVVDRKAGIYAGGFLLVLGFVPKLGGLISAMPAAAVGGAMLVAAGMLLAVGMRIAVRDVHTNRGLLIVGISCAFGIGISSVPELVQKLPEGLQPLLQSGTCFGALLAIVLNLVLPKASCEAGADSETPSA